jgi:hypothetical protein
MKKKYIETESSIFYKEISDKYKSDKNEKDLYNNLLKYKEIRSREVQQEVQKERDDKLNDLGIED